MRLFKFNLHLRNGSSPNMKQNVWAGYYNVVSLPQSNLHIGITELEDYNINDVQDALDKANDVNMDTPSDILGLTWKHKTCL